MSLIATEGSTSLRRSLHNRKAASGLKWQRRISIKTTSPPSCGRVATSRDNALPLVRRTTHKQINPLVPHTADPHPARVHNRQRDHAVHAAQPLGIPRALVNPV